MLVRMRGIRQWPFGVFSVLLAAAGLTLIIGWSLAREEREVLVEKDEESLKTFASGMRNGVDSLEKNFDRTLLDLCRKLDPGGSDRGMVTLAKTYAGIRQVSVVQPGKLGREPRVIKSLEIGGDYPLPILSGRTREVIDLERLDDPGVTYFWVADARDGLYFVSRQPTRNGSVLILGIDRDEVSRAMSISLMEWANVAHESLVSEEWHHEVMAPGGGRLVEYGESPGRPEIIYPISSRMGDWQIQVWSQREVVVVFQKSVFVVAGTIALGFLILGVVIFFLLNRSLALAEQRVSFVNQVSHELRTPMTNIMLNLDLVTEEVRQDSVIGRRLGLVGEELKRLHRLLENVLTFSGKRAEESVRELTVCSLEEVVRRVLAQS